MRLLHITTVSMSLTFLRGQIGFMRRRGLDVSVISSPGAELAEIAQAEGAGTVAVPMRRQITPLQDVAAMVALVAAIRRLRPTIVHAHTPKGGLLGMIAAALCRVPVRIYHMRGLPLMGARGWKRQLLRVTERVACGLAHEVICVSHSVRTEAVDAGLCPPGRIRVLLGGSGNGVDARGRFDPARQGDVVRRRVRTGLGVSDGDVVLGFVGRIVRDKGVVELVAAWQELRREHPEAHLLLVGPFEPQDPLLPEVEAVLHADERVHLAGMTWDTPPLYAAMDLVVLPTYREGFPNVPLEAAAMELPVVATRIPGCVDAVVEGETGLLVEPRDAADLAAAIRRYLADPALRREHGRAGRRRVLRDFRPAGIWEAIFDEYVRLLRARGLPLPRPADELVEVAP
jgi:glycosyltransferase involved in cell wall biosynthesis